MIQLSLKQLSSIIAGKFDYFSDISFTGISIDTRTLQPGNLFVALQGNQFDGHGFLAEAQRKGAAAAMVMKDIVTDLPCLKVADTCLALGKMAQFWRQSFELPLIGVTGSNGKTTTKNMLQAILLQAAPENVESVLATKGNFNNHIGLPLMLAQMNEKHRYAVIEMGMNHTEEIAYLTQLAKPTTALITNAGPCHLEGVGGTVAGVAQAKGEIFSGLSANGIAIINADDEFAAYWKSLVLDKKIITFGMENPADIRGECVNEGFDLHYKDQIQHIRLPLLGRHNVMNALAASAATIANGIDLNTIKIALEKLSAAPGRMEMKIGRHGARVIDDTYNANPLSLRVAIEAIARYPGKKILVVGDMRELGEKAEQFHEDSGKWARDRGINRLLATGELTKYTVKGFGKNAQHFPDHASLIQALMPHLEKNTIVLVKGSRSMKMEQVVSAIVAV